MSKHKVHLSTAGYLFGLAGECALKKIMSRSGMRKLPDKDRKDDPYYAHFPALKTLLRDKASGRFASEILAIVSKGNLMNHWEIGVRYAHRREVNEAWVEDWRENASKLKERMDSASCL